MTDAASPTGGRAPARRLDPAARRRQIVEGAADLFAERGLHVSTRTIADALGITQALLYRYFASKEALTEAVFDHLFLENRRAPDPALLRGPEPLAARVAAFYEDFFAATTQTSLKLFLRAAMDGHDLARRYAPRLDERVLRPLLAALRAEDGLAPPPAGPLAPAERELVLTLHGALVFLAIRRFVYGMDLDDRFATLLRDQVTTFLDGAPARLQALDAARSAG